MCVGAHQTVKCFLVNFSILDMFINGRETRITSQHWQLFLRDGVKQLQRLCAPGNKAFVTGVAFIGDDDTDDTVRPSPIPEV